MYDWIYTYITHRPKKQYGTSQRKMRVIGGGSGQIGDEWGRRKT